MPAHKPTLNSISLCTALCTRVCCVWLWLCLWLLCRCCSVLRTCVCLPLLSICIVWFWTVRRFVMGFVFQNPMYVWRVGWGPFVTAFVLQLNGPWSTFAVRLVVSKDTRL